MNYEKTLKLQILGYKLKKNSRKKFSKEGRNGNDKSVRTHQHQSGKESHGRWGNDRNAQNLPLT